MKIHLKKFTLGQVILTFALAYFALSAITTAQVCQEGCGFSLGNTFFGDSALLNNTSGFNNTAIGAFALQQNTDGTENTATGLGALAHNRTGIENTANGSGALTFSSIGNFNTATGASALSFNTTGDNNTANGYRALSSNEIGFSNTAIGVDALSVNRFGGNNIALGASAGNVITGRNNIDIGNAGVGTDSGVIRLGTEGAQLQTFIAGIINSPLAIGTAVGITSTGQLGVRVSAARFKDAIKPMDKASEAILSLQPVTFRYKKELDPEGIPQFGLVAEDVEKINPALVARDEQGKPYTVRYEAVNAMLLNEFLKEHGKNEKQEVTIGELKSTVAQQQKQIEALTAGLQKVSAQVEMSRHAPQTVVRVSD